ncbi:MAG: Uma2 family endonuclease [Thermostichus sp. DRC_bins_24]
MTISPLLSTQAPPPIRWEKLPEDFPLPDDPVESTLQPLLAAALRELLELADLIPAQALIASNFGLCSTVGDKVVVKAPDWVYVPAVQPIPEGEIRRNYTPKLEGDPPAIVMEFISETEGGEYSINPHHPYGKWYFYERILQVPVYVIFHSKTGELDVYRLEDGHYRPAAADENQRYWIPEIGLFLGVWWGQKAETKAYWLRWWDAEGNLLLWGSERIEQERQKAAQERLRAEQERLRAEQEHLRAEQERLRAEEAETALQQERAQRQRLADKLRELGLDLDTESSGQ